MSVELNYDDPQWCESEYNPRLRVADAATYQPKWSAWAAATRERLDHRSDLTYGPHPRETLDLFPAAHPRGACLFIHGGYWRSFSKAEFSWVAEALVAAGVSVQVVNYPLCPDVTIADIVTSVRSAVVALVNQHLTPQERAHFVVAGHSAGGYLAAAMAATDWRGLGLDGSPFVGAVPVSGVFDPRPLIATSINEQLRLTKPAAEALNLLAQKPGHTCPLVPIYGAEESAEFCRHSEDLAALWPQSRAAIGIDKRNHFNVIEGIADPNSEIFRTLLGLIEG